MHNIVHIRFVVQDCSHSRSDWFVCRRSAGWAMMKRPHMPKQTPMTRCLVALLVLPPRLPQWSPGEATTTAPDNERLSVAPFVAGNVPAPNPKAKAAPKKKRSKKTGVKKTGVKVMDTCAELQSCIKKGDALPIGARKFWKFPIGLVNLIVVL